MKNFYLIGLTGNLASGKSTIRKMLEKLGASGIDADLLAHAALRRGSFAWRAVLDEFGGDILGFNGRIDRQKLGARVFTDASALAKLEALVHPVVGAMTRELMRQAHTPIVVVEAVKLVEAGLNEWCDALWVVDCNATVQIERVVHDRNMSADAAKSRIAAQGSLDDKLKIATVIIDNSGDEQATRQQVERAWNSILAESARDKSAWLLGIQSPATAPSELPVAVIEPTTIAPSQEEQLDVPDWAKESIPELPPATTTRAVSKEPSPPIDSVAPVPTTPAEKQEALPTPAWTLGNTIEVHRARRSDLDEFALAIAKFEKRPQPLLREEAIKRMGERGYRIAVANKHIVAFAAWEAENLVAIVREIWAESLDVMPHALPQLFGLIEQEAKGLACEAAVLLISKDAMTLAAQAHASGYQFTEVADLHKMWRSVVQERTRLDEQIWLKRLREGMVTRPF